MTFFLDENIPKDAAALLASRGHETVDIRGTGHEGCDDKTVFGLSKDRECVFLTTDKDFFHTINFEHKPHAGIIVIALKQPDAQRIVSRLQWFLDNCMEMPLHDKCFLLSDDRCTIYS
ncbi:MAG: DUF5615 family PIN-like protein [Spirochaetota bacterium]